MEVDNKKITFKTANEAEVKIILETIYAPLGWGYVLEDYLSVIQHDPEAITIAVNENGEIIAGVAFMKINDTTAGFGCFCVKETYQGKGVGWNIFKLGLDRVQHLNITLTALEIMCKKYRVSGFPVVSEVKGIRYAGEIQNLNIKKTPSDVKIVDYTTEMLEGVLRYDKTVSLERDNFMKVFLPLVKGPIVIAQKNEQMLGYAILRGEANRLGPVFADDAEIALALIAALLERSAPHIEVIIDIPDCNSEMQDLAKNNNMKMVFCFPRMFSKEEIQSNWKKVYAFHSSELMYV